METGRAKARSAVRHRSLASALLLLAAGSALAIASCGGGGGSGGRSDQTNGLCEQCGESDGPCLPFAGIEENEPEAPRPCDVAEPDPVPTFPVPRPTCTVGLVCRRKLASAQRRCFPVEPSTRGTDQELAQQDFECDGSLPFPGTVTPKPTTPPPTPTLSQAPTPTPT